MNLADELGPEFAQSGLVMATRERYISLLQIVGTIAIIAFHINFRGTSAAWVAVELFFAIAGLHMARAVDRSEGLIDYARARIQRIAPEMAIIWGVVALMVIYGQGTPGSDWFLLTAPVFLQNLTLHLFEYQIPYDWVFTPLWFVAALLQLQLFVYAFRTVLVKSRPVVVVVAAVALGIAFRGLMAFALGGHGGEIDVKMADVLYSMPFTHIEAITLGFLVGRGTLVGIGRYLWPITFLAVGASAISGGLSSRPMPIGSFGLDFPLSSNYMHVWTYTLLAFAAAALCSPQNPIAVWVRSQVVSPRIDAFVSRLSALSFGTYVFHGLLVASGANMGPWLSQHLGFAGPMILVVTTVEAMVLAHLVQLATGAVRPVPRQDIPGHPRSTSAVRGPVRA